MVMPQKLYLKVPQIISTSTISLHTTSDFNTTKNRSICMNMESLQLTWPVAKYAPEFLNTEYDIPDTQVDSSYFTQYEQHMTGTAFIEDLLLAHKVLKSGKPNRYGCWIPVTSGWNLDRMYTLLQDYEDVAVVEWLRFGFPVSWDDERGSPTPADRNHFGATLFPSHIDAYLDKEIILGSTVGPFHLLPFVDRISISPLSSRPKKDSDQRRIILDLSFPLGESVNDGINKDMYCGTSVHLTDPRIDTLAKRTTVLQIF